MFGPELTADLLGCKLDLVDTEKLDYIMTSLVEVANMKVLVPSTTIYYEHPTSKLESGCTTFIVLVDSLASCHTFLNHQAAFINLFSCKDFNTDSVISYILGAFKPDKYTYKVNWRGEGYTR